MAADLAATPRSGLLVQCCGDAHLSNFGLYASPERRLVFDINDFDETLPGPWEWDVKRLAVSMLVAARNSGFSGKVQERIVLDTVGEYRTRMAQFAAMPNLEVWYTRFEIETLMPELQSQLGGKMRKRLDKAVAKAFTRDSVQAFSKLSQEVDGERRIISDPPLIVRLVDFPETEERDRVRADLERDVRLWTALCSDTGPRPRALRRSHRHRRLPRSWRRFRPGDSRVLRGLRRAERPRLQNPRRRRRNRPHPRERIH